MSMTDRKTDDKIPGATPSYSAADWSPACILYGWMGTPSVGHFTLRDQFDPNPLNHAIF
jgi:hypothetical protein